MAITILIYFQSYVTHCLSCEDFTNGKKNEEK